MAAISMPAAETVTTVIKSAVTATMAEDGDRAIERVTKAAIPVMRAVASSVAVIGTITAIITIVDLSGN